MKILLGYGFYPYTTGTYFERVMAQKHECVYVGTPWGAKPGFAPNVDLRVVSNELKINPDFYLFIDSGHAAHLPHGLHKVPFPTACYLIDVHLGLKLRLKLASFFDYVFVAQKDYVQPIKGALQHDNVYWLPLACDPQIHKKSAVPRLYDIGFVGSVGGDHAQRRSMLETLSLTYKVNNYLRPHSREEMALVYSQSKIVVNKSIQNEVNMRVFEATSCGALLITDRIGNGLEELFEDRRDIITYGDMAEMLELVRYHLEHDEEREATAEAGHKKAVTKHTYDARLEQVLETVFADGRPCLGAPIRKQADGQVHISYSEAYAMLRLIDCTVNELTALRTMGRGRSAAARQVLFAMLRRLKYG